MRWDSSSAFPPVARGTSAPHPLDRFTIGDIAWISVFRSRVADKFDRLKKAISYTAPPKAKRNIRLSTSVITLSFAEILGVWGLIRVWH